ncbi:hypothetical protein OY671_012886, partial [Metschnikowia pulcherrima]
NAANGAESSVDRGAPGLCRRARRRTDPALSRGRLRAGPAVAAAAKPPCRAHGDQSLRASEWRGGAAAAAHGGGGRSRSGRNAGAVARSAWAGRGSAAGERSGVPPAAHRGNAARRTGDGPSGRGRPAAARAGHPAQPGPDAGGGC